MRRLLNLLRRHVVQRWRLGSKPAGLPELRVTRLADSDWVLIENDAIAQHILRGEVWEPHVGALIRHFVKPGDVALDVGANFGFHTVALAKQVGPRGMVLAFEPLRIIYQQLCANVFVNRLVNVYAFNKAVTEHAGQLVEMNPVDLGRDWVNIGDTRVGAGGDRVETVSLDSLKLPRVNFVKIDVQGYEPAVLKGALETIGKCRPIMVVEVEEHHLRAFGSSSQAVLECLLGLKYRLFRIMTAYPCDHLAVPIEHTCESSELEKVLGVPVQRIEGQQVEVFFSEKYGGTTYDHCITVPLSS